MLNNSNFIECPVCRLFEDFDDVFADFPEIEGLANSEDLLPTTYNALREEMIESFTRVANARNWAIVVFIGGVTALGIDELVKNHKIIIILLPLFSSILLYLLSQFALNAYSSAWSLGASLLAHEVYFKKHFANEHASWSEFMDISGHSNRTFFERNYGVQLNNIAIRMSGDAQEERIAEYEIFFNSNLSPLFKVRNPGKWVRIVISDFYFWLALFNIMVTLIISESTTITQWLDLYNNIFFYISISLQIVIVAWIIYFIRLERIFFKLAFLESIFKFIRLKRGIRLKITYPWFFDKFFKIYD